ncbi:flippase [Anaerocolumna chitinilytica]|uniref:Heteropolysaccharide repeat-containing protein n=1 Tax=Anaerocolumna chitinilytica TaxID=1727145 RepID=A0A7I8DFR5_9FIRM|nr:flippase [Anaerocolumna chitinilytica]BCJ97363.1 heteropolysaccharide repeat-containing protein [Anaerocolumna chitinilytica]
MNKDIKIKSVKYNFAMNIILKMSSFIFPLITLPYITRTLGAVGNGKIAFASSVITYFSMFAQLGIPTYGIRVCAKCRDDKAELTKTVQELLVINGVAVILSYLALGFSIIGILKFQENSTLMLINSVSILLNAIGMEWLYQAIEQYQYITIRNLVFKIISIVLMFWLIHKPEDYIKYAILIVISAGGSYILNLINCRNFLEHRLYIGKYKFRKHLKPIFTFFALSVSISIYTSMDTVMLGFFSGDEQVAFYALSTKIKMVLATTISALGPVLLPRIVYCINNGQREKFKSYIEKSLHFVTLIAIPVTIYFVVMAPTVVDILGGEAYISATLCMQIITITIIPLGIGNVACSQILTPMGKEKYTMYSTVCGAIINFALNIVLIPRFGAAGAAIATVFAEAIIACIQIYYVRSEVRTIILHLPYMKFLTANATGIVCLILFTKYVSIGNSLVEMVVTCCLFFGIYMTVMITLGDELLQKYIIQLFYKK